MPAPERLPARNAADDDERIDLATMQRLRRLADRDPEVMSMHLRRLDREWDVERVLQAHGALIGLAGLALGVTRDRRWMVLPGIVLSLLGLHATQGSSPPGALLRRLGVRTRREIERERYALKALRGDFEGAAGRSQAAWRAVRGR